MDERINRAIAYIAAMRVDGDNQELAVAAKNELKVALAIIENANHNATEQTENIKEDQNHV